jgi:hypothetical protein
MVAPQVQPRPRPQARVYAPPQRNIFLRALRIAVITAILIAIPAIVAYLAFHYAQGTPAWPVRLSW